MGFKIGRSSTVIFISNFSLPVVRLRESVPESGWVWIQIMGLEEIAPDGVNVADENDIQRACCFEHKLAGKKKIRQERK